jgi:hypothetical protein
VKPYDHLCKICSSRQVEDQHEHCELCTSLLKSNITKDWNIKIEQNTRDEIVQLMAGAKQTPTKWKRLTPMLDIPELEWFKLNDGSDPVQQLPCDEDEFSTIINLKFTDGPLCERQHAILRRGVELHDGTVISIHGDDCFIDNFKVAKEVPIGIFFRIMSNPIERKGWDLKQFFLAASAFASSIPEAHEQRMFRLRFQGRRRRRTAGEESFYAMLRWLGSKITCSRESDGLSSSIHAWAYDVNSFFQNRERRSFHENYTNAIKNIPDDLEDLFPEPWVQAWNKETNLNHEDENQVAPIRFSKGKVKVRARRVDGSSFWISVIEHPLHIAFVLSACFYPVDHPARKLFSALQSLWFKDDHKKPITETPFGVSVQFLQGCLDVLGENAVVHRNSILIRGKFGHYYELKLGYGAHGAPYLLRPLDCQGTTIQYRESLCIHNGPTQRRLPIGDTIGSVVMSIANDAISSRLVDSLRHHIVRNGPLLLTPTNQDEFFQQLDIPEFHDFVRQHPFRGRNDRQFDEHGDMGRRPRWFHRIDETNSELTRQLSLIHNNDPFRRWMQNRIGDQRRMGGDGDDYEMKTKQGVPRTTIDEFTHREAVLAWKRLVDQSIRMDKQDYDAGVRINRDRIQEYMGRYIQNPPYIHDIFRNRETDKRIHGCGDIRDGERRWCETFARAWECLHLQPIESTFQLHGADTKSLAFQHFKLKITIRERDEERFIRHIAELVGYELLLEDEQNLVMIRKRHPRADARIEVARMLNQLQQKQGAEKAPPRWWNYIDRTQAPEELEKGRWQLHEDLQDDKKGHKDGIRFGDL